MKKILLSGLIILGMISCQKEPLPVPPTPVQDPKLELEVEEVGKTSIKVNTKVLPGSYSIVSQGVCYDKSQSNPTTENQKVSGVGSINLVNLDPGSKYYVRAYASTASKTFYSNAVEVNTKNIVVSVEILSVDYREASIKVNIDEESNDILERGIIYSQKDDFSSNITVTGSNANLKLLEYEGTYFVKAYVKLANATIFSKDTSFTTKKLDRVTDYDGNVYRIIEMPSTKGPRFWLLDNFKGTHYANGDPIPNVTDDEEWTKLESGAYCYYDNNKEHAKTYGALYNYWVAVDPRGLIPGWHTPSDEEWFEMSEVVGGGDWTSPEILTIGGKLKQAGTSHWQAPNTGATNETGFTALPAGVRRSIYGKFNAIRTYTIFFSSTSIGESFWSKILYHNKSEFHETAATDNRVGGSIRLIKNN